MLGADRRPTCCATTVVACIGPVTAEAAVATRDCDRPIIPERYTIPALVDALVEHFEDGVR